MRRFLPYPFLWLSLFAMWLLLNGGVRIGDLLLGAAVASFGCFVAGRIAPDPVKPRRLGTIVALLGVFVADVVRSNIAVIRLVLSGREPRSAFLPISLELRDPTGLAILAGIVTATPGSAWIQYDSYRSIVTIHVLDVIDDADWIADLKRNYERRLIEILQ